MDTEAEVRLARETFLFMAASPIGFAPMARIDAPDGVGLALLPLEGITKWQVLADLCKEHGATSCVFMADSWATGYRAENGLLVQEGERTEALCVTIFSADGWSHHVLPYHREGGSVVWEEEIVPDEVESEGAMLVLAALS